MKFILRLLGTIALPLLTSAACLAKPWRALAPLITTRAQVLEVLGSPKLNAANQTESFDLANEVAVFRWVRPTCGTQMPIPKGESFRPTDLVLQITVNPKIPLETKPAEFQTNPETYRDWLESDIDCIGNVDGHWSCSIFADGFGYSTATDGRITVLYYFASASEAKDWNATHKSCATAAASTLIGQLRPARGTSNK